MARTNLPSLVYVSYLFLLRLYWVFVPVDGRNKYNTNTNALYVYCIPSRESPSHFFLLMTQYKGLLRDPSKHIHLPSSPLPHCFSTVE